MTDDRKDNALYRWRILLICSVVIAAGAALYFAGLGSNPSGFFIDESSIAYNAHTISQTGRDEHGMSWPLFFRAFGEFKNPVYIYLLAALFRLTGPGIVVSRAFSAAAGITTAVILGLLAARITGRRTVALFLAVSTLLTPWMFELSRLVMEVTLYPLVLALFLVCVRRASTRLKWTWVDIMGLTATLALLTYTYSIGRLLAPLLALGFLFFSTRDRMRSILLTWGTYALTVLPLLIFQWRHPGSLTSRFLWVTYIKPPTTVAEIAWNFLKHYFGNINPWRLFVTEHSNVTEIMHLRGAPLLATTGLLAMGGVILLMRQRRIDPWWRFVLYGLVVSVVPAALTNEYFHMLRLSALPVFILVLTIPAIIWLVENARRARRAAFMTAIALTLLQGAFFQWQYRKSADAPRRLHLFDVDYPAKILPAALNAAGSRPIYIADAPGVPGYIQAYWYATLWQIPYDRFVRLELDVPAPDGAVVIKTEDAGPRCRWLTSSEPYTVCVEEGPPRRPAALPENGFRAEISVAKVPSLLSPKQQVTIEVSLRNPGNDIWLARERIGSKFQLSLGNHWLDPDGRTVVNDDGRRPLFHDLRPGETVSISLIVNAPERAGDYLLEIDMVQEGVTWFGQKGSPTWRAPVRVQSSLF